MLSDPELDVPRCACYIAKHTPHIPPHSLPGEGCLWLLLGFLCALYHPFMLAPWDVVTKVFLVIIMPFLCPFDTSLGPYP